MKKNYFFHAEQPTKIQPINASSLFTIKRVHGFYTALLLALLLGFSNFGAGQNKAGKDNFGPGKKDAGVQMATVQSDKVPENIQIPEQAVSNDNTVENIIIPPATDAPLVARTASVSGNWSDIATWGGTAVPTSADAVTINNGISVTVDVAATCASLTTVNTGGITISGSNSLTVTGLITMARPGTNATNFTIAVGAGTLSCGSLTMAATTTTRNDILSISTGNVTVTGTLTTGTTGCQITFTGAGTLNLGGTITGTPAFTSVAGSVVNYTGATAQTLIPGTYGILSLTGAGTKTIAASKTVQVNGNCTNGSTLVLTAGTSATSTYLVLGANLTNSPGATINGTAAYTVVYFLGSLAQTFTNDGTVTAPMYTLALGNTAGLSLLGANQIVCQRVNLYYGLMTNSNRILLGNGGTTYGVVQIGASTTYAAGSFDQPPVFNAGTGGYQLLYAPALNDYSTSYEVPADGNIAYLLLVCTPRTLSITRDVTIPYVYTTGLNFSSGNLNIGAHTLTVNGTIGIVSGTATGGTSSNISFSGGSGAPATLLPAVSGGLNNLTINNGGLTLNGAVTVNGTLSLVNGLVNNGAYLTMATGSTIFRAAGSLTNAPTFAGTVNLTYSGASPITMGMELPTTSSALNNLTTNLGGLTQYAYTSSTTNLLTDAFPNLTSWTGNIGTGSMQFAANASALAGGTSPEGRYYSTEGTHSNVTNYIYRGPVNTTGYNAVNVAFKSYATGNYIQNYPTYLKLQSATSTSGPWHDVWSMAYAAHAASSISIPNYTNDVGGNMYFQFAFVGDPYALDSWNFDNLVVDGVVITPVASTATVNGVFDVIPLSTYNIGANNTLILNDGGTGTGTINVSSTSNLIIGGTANLTLPAITGGLNNFTVGRTNGVNLSSDMTVNGTLTLSAGLLSLGSGNLILGPSSPGIAGTPGVTNMIVTNGSGEVRKNFTANGSFLFPVGDNTGTPDYTPMTLNFTSGSYSGGYAGVKVKNAKHPSNASTTNYLDRYWTVSSSGITAFSCNVTGTYVPADIAGTEGSQVTGKYSGSLPWVKFAPLGANTLTAMGVTGFSDFTGISLLGPTVNITPNPSLSVCPNAALTLTANPVGDPTFTYLWSPGGEITQSINPSTLLSGSAGYTVTVTDGNGFTATSSATVVVKTAPTLFTVAGGGSYCEGGTGVYIFLSGSELGVNYELWKDGFATGTIIPGTTCCGLAFPGVITPGTYTIVGTNVTDGCSTIMSGSVTVIVNPVPSINSTVAGSTTACSGASINVTVSPSVIGTNYQLRNDADNSLVGLPVAGDGGTINLPTGPVTVTTTFNVLATMITTGCSATLTGKATITVNPLPAIDLIVDVAGGQVCSGTGTYLTIASSEVGTTYQLRNNADNSLIGSPVPGDGGTISLPTGPLTGTTTFNVLATIVATGCSAQLTGIATVVTVPNGPVTTISNVNVCTGATYVDIPITVSSFNNVGSFSLTFGFTPTELRAPRIVSRNAAFDLPGHAWPVFDSTTNLIILASGKYKVSGLGYDPTDGVTLGVGETIFTLRFNIVSGTTLSNLTFKEDAQGTACEFTGIAFDYNPFCDSPTASFYIPGVVKVNPAGQVNDPADQVVCNGALTTAVNFTTTNVVGTTTYAWTNNTTSIGLGASGTGNIGAFTASNTGTAPVVATITVTPTLTDGGTSCVGLPQTFTITVNPSGQVNDPADQVVCKNASTTLVTFGTINTVGITNYTWANTTTSIGLGAAGTGDIASFTAANTTNAPVVATITVTPHFTYESVTCDGTAQTFTITVNPAGQVNDPADQVVCNGALTTAVTFTTSNMDGTTTYTWSNNTTSIGLGATGTGNISAFTAANTTTAPIVATITVTPHFTNGSVTCDGTLQTFTITVNPSGQVNVPGDQVVCNNASTTLVTFGTVNTVGTTTYTWVNNTTSIGLGASGTGDISSFTATNTTTAPVVATITVTAHFEYGSVTCDGTAQFSITVNPTGQVNDPADQVVCNGGSTSSVTFTTNNTVGTTNYTWTNTNISIGLGSSGSGNIPSFTATNSTNAPVIATVTVTPHFKNSSVTCDGPSTDFTITVNPTGQVIDPSDQTVCNGANTSAVNFATSNSGGNATYTWTNTNSSIGLAAAGTGNIAAFVAVNSSNAPVTATITVRPYFENGSVSCSGPTENFTITVNPSGHVNQPVSQVVCNGNNTSVSFGTDNTGGTTTYLWTNNNPAIGLDPIGVGNISFVATNTGNQPVFAIIVVTPTFTNNSVSCSGPTKTFSITVNPTGQVNQPDNQIVCNGSSTSATFSTVNIDGTTTYSWTNNTPGIGLAGSGTGNISAFTAINTGTSPVVATITVTPTFEKKSVSCPGLFKTFTITVNPSGQVNKPGDQVVCNGGSTTLVDFTSNNLGGTTSYTWTNNTTSIGLAASGSGNISSFTAANTGSAPVVATITVTPHFENGLVTCDGLAQTFTFTVNPSGQVNDPGDQVVCNGASTSAVTFSTNNTVGSTTYTWTNTNTSIGIGASGTGNLPVFTAINTGNAPVVASFDVTATFTYEGVSCVGLSQTFTITVNPTGQMNGGLGNQELCNGALTTEVDFTTNNTGGVTTYNWTNNLPSIGLGASGTGNIAAFTAINTGNGPVTAMIVVTPVFTNGSVGCSGPTESFYITVNPTGQVIDPADQVLCNGSTTIAVNFTTTNTGGTTLYSWVNDTPGIGLAVSGNGNIDPFTAINTGAAPVVATIVVTPRYVPGGCVGTPQSFTITVNPTGQMNQPADQIVGNGENTAVVAFTTINTVGVTTYTWTNNLTSIGLAASGTGNIAAFTAINSGAVPVVATITVTPTFTFGSVGCPGPPKTFTITVNPKPILVITNQVACSPNRVDLTDPSVTAGSFLPPVTILTYWNDATATTSPVATPTAVGNGTYYIKATITPGGWFDIKPVVVTINQLPIVYFGVPATATICANGPGITVGITGSQIGVSYSVWIGITQVSPVVAGTGGPIFFAPPLTLPGNYWVLAENMTTHCFNRMYECMIITTYPPVQVSVSIATPTITVPADQNVTFTSTAVNGGVSPFYQWKVNGFDITGANGPTYTYKPVNGDAVTCLLTSSEICNSGPATSNTIIMTVTGVSVGSITVTGNVASGETKCYNALQTITVAGGGTKFVVKTGGSATFIAGQNIIYLPGTTVEPGGYMHGKIFDGAYCGYKSPSLVNSAEGTVEQPVILQNSSFKLYPNPTTGNFTLEQTSGSLHESVKVEIYGIQGGRVMSGELTREKKHEFSISDFPAGLYFVKVVAGNEAETIKLVKIN